MELKSWRFRDNQRPWLIGAAVAAVIAMAGVLLAGGGFCLEVRRCETAAPILSLEMKPGQAFSVWFFHSYDRSFFEEHYRLEQDGRIVLTHMTFKSNLNGQGFEMGVYRPRPDGSAELADINKEIPEILFRLGSPDLANHTLVIDERRLRLLDYFEAGDMICMRSGFYHRWQRAWDKLRVIWYIRVLPLSL
jgi:hypothetical protein